MSAEATPGASGRATFAAAGEDTPPRIGGRLPEAVLRPSSVEEVREALAAAGRDGLGVVPLGAGTDPGCEAPDRPFVVLSTRALDGIEDYEPADLTVTARAGTRLGQLATELSARGQWLPADPPHARRRTLGGLVATGAAGPLGTAYGAPRDHVLGLTVVTGDGRILRLGGRVMKNVAGFDLVKLVVGSRGTLGIVVSATVRLFPLPEEDRALVFPADGAAAMAAAALGVATAPVVPASAVLVAPAPAGTDAAAALVVRLQGSRATVEADERRLRSTLGGDGTCVAGPAAGPLLEAVADHAAAGELVVRGTALPTAMAALIEAFARALPGADVSVDPLRGRVRAGLPAAEGIDAEALLALRRDVEGRGGSLVLERAPPVLAASVGAYGSPGSARTIGAALRTRFDPGGVLSPGRFLP